MQQLEFCCHPEFDKWFLLMVLKEESLMSYTTTIIIFLSEQRAQ